MVNSTTKYKTDSKLKNICTFIIHIPPTAYYRAKSKSSSFQNFKFGNKVVGRVAIVVCPLAGL